MEDDHGSQLRFEPEEAALESVAVLDHRHLVDDRGDRDGRQFDIEPMASEPARLIDAGVDQQAMQPGIEAVGIAERGQITPGPDECVLHGVLGLFDIPEHEPRGPIQTGDRGACQLGEGVMIALPRSLHEVSLHHAPRRWRDHHGRARRVWRGDLTESFRSTVRRPDVRR